MNWTDWLAVAANIASIMTAAAATIFTARIWLQARNRRRRVEGYLRNIWEADQEARVPLRIAAELDMPLEEVRAALNSSRRVNAIPIQQPGSNRVDGLAYRYGSRRQSR